eukprot:12456947-Alexandrium_andersonii.AAC.1
MNQPYHMQLALFSILRTACRGLPPGGAMLFLRRDRDGFDSSEVRSMVEDMGLAQHWGAGL